MWATTADSKHESSRERLDSRDLEKMQRRYSLPNRYQLRLEGKFSQNWTRQKCKKRWFLGHSCNCGSRSFIRKAFSIRFCPSVVPHLFHMKPILFEPRARRDRVPSVWLAKTDQEGWILEQNQSKNLCRVLAFHGQDMRGLLRPWRVLTISPMAQVLTMAHQYQGQADLSSGLMSRRTRAHARMPLSLLIEQQQQQQQEQQQQQQKQQQQQQQHSFLLRRSFMCFLPELRGIPWCWCQRWCLCSFYRLMEWALARRAWRCWQKRLDSCQWRLQISDRHRSALHRNFQSFPGQAKREEWLNLRF